ncbi:MAG: OmpA family protein [Fusobacteriaceae bacterium]
MFLKKSIITVFAGLTLVGCTNNPFLSPYDGGINTKTSGSLGGAALGALAGQAIGGDTKGTLIGAGIGALAGLGWGAYRDKQEMELKRSLKNSNVNVTREGDFLNLTLPGGVTFHTNSSTISPNFYESLNSIASVLTQYPESRINVAGFTDNVGSAPYNVTLSQQRAGSVTNYLVKRGVASGRIASTGYGSSNFVATNSTPIGRSMNRRVEIKILPPTNY